MSKPLGDSARTSNDLLRDLVAKHAEAARNCQIVAQKSVEVQNIHNAPAVSMTPYLIESDQTPAR